MSLGIPSVLNLSLFLVALIGGWFFKGMVIKWIQAYNNKKQTEDLEKARKQTQEEAQKANSDSDSLKNIDGR